MRIGNVIQHYLQLLRLAAASQTAPWLIHYARAYACICKIVTPDNINCRVLFAGRFQNSLRWKGGHVTRRRKQTRARASMCVWHHLHVFIHNLHVEVYHVLLHALLLCFGRRCVALRFLFSFAPEI